MIDALLVQCNSALHKAHLLTYDSKQKLGCYGKTVINLSARPAFKWSHILKLSLWEASAVSRAVHCAHHHHVHCMFWFGHGSCAYDMACARVSCHTYADQTWWFNLLSLCRTLPDHHARPVPQTACWKLSQLNGGLRLRLQQSVHSVVNHGQHQD